MRFVETINKQFSMLHEADADTAPNDATAPDPNAQPAPAATGDKQQIPVAPEGYVDIVRLLVKATAMNFPAGALDELYRTPVTEENAFDVQKAITATLKQYEMSGDNAERLDNPNYNAYIESINTSNFINKLKYVESIINTRNPSNR